MLVNWINFKRKQIEKYSILSAYLWRFKDQPHNHKIYFLVHKTKYIILICINYIYNLKFLNTNKRQKYKLKITINQEDWTILNGKASTC